MMTFVVYKFFPGTRTKPNRTEEVDRFSGTLEECRKICVERGYAHVFNGQVKDNPRFDIRTV